MIYSSDKNLLKISWKDKTGIKFHLSNILQIGFMTEIVTQIL